MPQRFIIPAGKPAVFIHLDHPQLRIPFPQKRYRIIRAGIVGDDHFSARTDAGRYKREKFFQEASSVPVEYDNGDGRRH
jgi:hypothetical protein